MGNIFHLGRSRKEARSERAARYLNLSLPAMFGISSLVISPRKAYRVAKAGRVLGSLQIGFPSDNLLSPDTADTEFSWAGLYGELFTEAKNWDRGTWCVSLRFSASLPFFRAIDTVVVRGILRVS